MIQLSKVVLPCGGYGILILVEKYDVLLSRSVTGGDYSWI